MELGVKWVVIKSYSYPYEAQIAKARLTSVGIPAMIENEHTINELAIFECFRWYKGCCHT